MRVPSAVAGFSYTRFNLMCAAVIFLLMTVGPGTTPNALSCQLNTSRMDSLPCPVTVEDHSKQRTSRTRRPSRPRTCNEGAIFLYQTDK